MGYSYIVPFDARMLPRKDSILQISGPWHLVLELAQLVTRMHSPPALIGTISNTQYVSFLPQLKTREEEPLAVVYDTEVRNLLDYT